MTATTPHAHDWKPTEEYRQYACACGATGYKKVYPAEYNPRFPHARVGDILEHAEPRTKHEVTARSGAGKHMVGGISGNYQHGPLSSGTGQPPPRHDRKRKG